MNTVYLLRDPATGLYWRKGKTLYSQVTRTNWVTEPAKAWYTHAMAVVKQQMGSWTYLASCEVVPFNLVEACPDPSEGAQ